LDPASGPLVYHEIEASYAALGRAREFESFIRGLLERNPDDVAARCALAGWLAARGEVDQAVSALQRVLKHHPDDLGARAALGRILLSANRARDLMQEYATLIEVLERRGLLGPAEKLE
jgi:Flp pilus assembly protein TadD